MGEQVETTTSSSCDSGGLSDKRFVGARVCADQVIARRVGQGRERISVGASVRLWSVDAIAEDLGIDYESTEGLLDTLGICLLKLPGTTKRYVNLYWLESALFSFTTPGTFVRTADGAIDPILIRLHQELAGAMYLAASKEAIRERVKKLARAMNKGLTPAKKPPIIVKQPRFSGEDYRAL